jgi:mannose-6-phosphate isomerase-like protein (cupin superfamily)
MSHNDKSLVSGEHERKRDLSTGYQVMRVDDVKVREAEHDRRLFYFDDTVDIVVVTSTERHIEPAHLHAQNTEIYYVIQGKLLLGVDGHELWLNEGDLVTVYPGACHHFETTDEKVVFMAIKKEPGLADKELC